MLATLHECLVFLSLPDPPLTLVAVKPVLNATEPDTGETATLIACVEATVAQTRKSDAVFKMVLNTSTTTATPEEDFYLNTSLYITIPAGFQGNFSECIVTVVIGDDIIESTELIEGTLEPQYSGDVVEYAGNVNSLLCYIFDNDGELIFGCIMHIQGL